MRPTEKFLGNARAKWWTLKKEEVFCSCVQCFVPCVANTILKPGAAIWSLWRGASERERMLETLQGASLSPHWEKGVWGHPLTPSSNPLSASLSRAQWQPFSTPLSTCQPQKRPGLPSLKSGRPGKRNQWGRRVSPACQTNSPNRELHGGPLVLKKIN